MTKREKGAERRERLEAIQREQKAEARKRNLITAAVGISIGAVIIGGTTAFIVSQESSKPGKEPLSAYGVPASAAACKKVVVDATDGAGDHVGPGTSNPVSRVTYKTVPPSSGPHFPIWLPSSRNFYAPNDPPVVEQLVHNLEHGYSVLWYSPDLTDAERSDVEGLAESIAADLKGNKFIAAEMNTKYGALPEGTKVAFSHWGAKQGFRQLCGEVSGEAAQKFVEEHPASDSPEPNAS